ncbi:hypothetical protein D3C75_968510 [compost metagenome]
MPGVAGAAFVTEERPATTSTILVMVFWSACVGPTTVQVALTVATPKVSAVTAWSVVQRLPVITDSKRLPAGIGVPGVAVKISSTLEREPLERIVPVSEQTISRSWPLALFGSLELYACCRVSSKA